MAGLIRPLFAEPIKHVYQLATNHHYFTYHWLVSKLRWMPRYKPFSIRLHGWRLTLPDVASFLAMYRSIFLERLYDFPWADEKPRILDLGANVGLSILFFKSVYPNSEIVAFEPDKDIFDFLVHNVHGNGYRDVQLVNKAVWITASELPFLSEGADAGRLVLNSEEGNTSVETLDFGKYLKDNAFDMIKMDVEGAETIILPSCCSSLHLVRFLYLEFHSYIGRPQGLAEVVQTLEQAGFRLSFKEIGSLTHPFRKGGGSLGDIDFQAHIFARRI